jgi:protein-S-isoprenylcysteine O-methyltransferase Ste14
MGSGIATHMDAASAASSLHPHVLDSGTAPLAAVLVWSPPGVVRVLGGAVALSGIALAAWSLAALGRARFFGRAAAARFVLRGPYKRVRHPFYCGVLLCTLGLFAVFPSVVAGVLAAVCIAAVAVAIPIEERRLIGRFGEAYRRYRSAVPGLLPVGSRPWHPLA